MPASVSGSETYFSPDNHLRSSLWAKIEEPQKAAAIAHAKRILNRACAVDDIETEIDVTNAINPEWAIYEQALYMLMNQPMDNKEGSFAVALAADPESDTKARKAETGLLAPEAVQWLSGGYRGELSRG